MAYLSSILGERPHTYRFDSGVRSWPVAALTMMGGRRESHPPAPPEPGVNLSAHRAPIIRFVLRPHVGGPPIASVRGAPGGLA